MMDKIFINGLKVSCIIGILPDERVREQPLIMDVVMEHSLKQAGEKGDLNLSINYAMVASFCMNFAKERKAFLQAVLRSGVTALSAEGNKSQGNSWRRLFWTITADQPRRS